MKVDNLKKMKIVKITRNFRSFSRMQLNGIPHHWTKSESFEVGIQCSAIEMIDIDNYLITVKGRPLLIKGVNTVYFEKES